MSRGTVVFVCLTPGDSVCVVKLHTFLVHFHYFTIGFAVEYFVSLCTDIHLHIKHKVHMFCLLYWISFGSA